MHLLKATPSTASTPEDEIIAAERGRANAFKTAFGDFLQVTYAEHVGEQRF